MSGKKINRTQKIIMVMAALCIIAFLAVTKPIESIFFGQKSGCGNNDYVIRHYKMKNKKFSHRLKIALISDFHDRNIQDIPKKVAEYKPDVILLPGDIFERTEKTIASPVVHPFVQAWRDFVAMSKETYDEENSRKFVAELGKIAPVYISRGNHEEYYLPKDILAIVNSGATLLDNNYIETELNGMKIKIGGLSTEYNEIWLTNFSKKDGIKILMSHHPEYYVNCIKDTAKDNFDLIVAGHAHGGQWRIFDKGIYAYGQGLFPKYTRNIHGKMVVSAGISNSVFIRRIKNPKEIVFIEISQ